jgi:hypothetical protein
MTRIEDILFGKLEGGRQLGRPRPRWDDNIQKEFTKKKMRLWTGFMWLKSNGGLL